MQGTVDFTMETCCNCGIPFYMTSDLNKRLRNAPGASFFCPNGHGQHYTGKSETQQLKERLAVAERDNKYLTDRVLDERRTKEAAQRSLVGVRGHLTRAKNELVKGNCPNCEEHFDDLEQHIKARHPDFELEPAETPEPVFVKAKRGRPRKAAITIEQPAKRADRKAAVEKALENAE